jgi:hypothetical protein
MPKPRKVKKTTKAVKAKKPILNELIMDTYLKSINEAIRSGKKPDSIYKRLTELVDEMNAYKGRS